MTTFEIIEQFVAMFITFLFVNWLVYMVTERWGLPKWLQYRPFVCRTCCTFWTLIGVGVIYALSGMTITAIGLAILAVLNAIAMKVDQKKKTISDVNSYHLEKNEEDEKN